jgi:hypothetical protein
MTTETTYNPVARPSFLECMADIYYGSAAGQFGIEASFFIVGCGVIAAVAFAFAA